MKTFENWYTSILEEVATQPTKTLSGDVDTIINSLGTLVKELTEELDSPEFNKVNEADGEGPSKVWQWIWWMPKARKAQQKVNKIKLNITDIESAAADAPDKEQRAKINAKATQSKKQADELQKMVDDKYGAKGELVKRALHSEKIAGQIASIKRATGLEDNPEKVASYKEKMAELQKKYKEDQEAIAELEPSEEDKKAEKEAREKEEKEAAERQAELDAAANRDEETTTEESTETTTEESTTEESTTEESTTEESTTEESTTEESTTEESTTEESTTEESTTEESTTEESTTEESTTEETTTEEETTTRRPNESLTIRAKAVGLNELASEIASKFDWQVSEGTVLYQKYDAIIKKTEYSNTLNESRYQNLSVKDRFSRLM